MSCSWVHKWQSSKNKTALGTAEVIPEYETQNQVTVTRDT